MATIRLNFITFFENVQTSLHTSNEFGVQLCELSSGQGKISQQMVNYYRGSGVICRKVSFIRKINELLEVHPEIQFQWLIKTFIVYPKESPGNSDEFNRHSSIPDLKKLKQRARSQKDTREKLVMYNSELEKAGKSKVWIAKSSSGSQGVGMKISENVEELIDFVDTQFQAHIIQEYILNPLLLCGDRKFDIRCWVLLDHKYKIHLYREGVLRTSSDKYDCSDFQNITAHLTNHHLQEQLSTNYGRFEEGNEMFYDEFEIFLREKYRTSLSDHIMPQIKQAIKDTLIMIKPDVHTEGVDYESFQLFGYDFLIDEDFRVWILEINANPACAQKLLNGLVESMVKVTVCDVFENTEDDYENKFDLLE